VTTYIRYDFTCAKTAISYWTLHSARHHHRPLLIDDINLDLRDTNNITSPLPLLLAQHHPNGVADTSTVMREKPSSGKAGSNGAAVLIQVQRHGSFFEEQRQT
jgi:hypothetical protein